jgi:hypothetical protein
LTSSASQNRKQPPSHSTGANQAEIALYPDHPVGLGEKLRMNFEAKRLGDLEVDHELELDGTQRMANHISFF